MNTHIKIIGILSLFLGIHLTVAQAATAKTMGSSKTSNCVVAKQTSGLNGNPDSRNKQNMPETTPPPNKGTAGGGGR